MSNNSFYGGQPGASFIIAKSFSSVAEMATSFRKGPDYTSVRYNEYVLINTEDKNSPENGCIYRRGYDFQDALGGAIYVGTIVGPAGKAPMLELTTIADVEEQSGKTSYGDKRSGKGSYTPTAANLIPGKTDSGVYNDSIEWAYCSIRNENAETIAYIGFKIPYLVEEFTASQVNAYYTDALVERTDDKSHPFYQSWKINIPKGIKGDTLKNFRVMTADSSIETYTGRKDDIDNSRKVLVYDYYDYSASENGTKKTIYLGDYNMITGITLDGNGTFTISYSHDSKASYTLNWVSGISIDAKGNITLQYAGDKANTTLTNTHLRWISNVVLASDGTLTVNYNDGTKDVSSNKIKFLNNIYFSNTDNKFHVAYNDSTDNSVGEVIKYVKSFYVDESDYKFHITYNTGDEVVSADPINFVYEMAIDQTDYHLLAYYNNANFRNDLIEQGKARTYNNKTGWLDLGSVKDDSGVMIGFNLDPKDYPNGDLDSTSSVVSYLNTNYPNGLTSGKIVTVGRSDTDKELFAYDYNTNKWYYLGMVGGYVYTMVCSESDPTKENLQANLNINGVWFIVED